MTSSHNIDEPPTHEDCSLDAAATLLVKKNVWSSGLLIPSIAILDEILIRMRDMNRDKDVRADPLNLSFGARFTVPKLVPRFQL